MEVKNFSQLLGQRKFRVPNYQRGYSWEEAQWKDFFDDIDEVIKFNRSDHYCGTLILRDTGQVESHGVEQWEVFEVIDGQQRLITAMLLLSKIIRKLDALGIPGVERLRQNYIGYGGLVKIDLLGTDDAFFKELLNGEANHEPQTRSQRRLEKAITYFGTRLEPYDAQGAQDLLQALLYKLKVLDFQVSDPGLAVVIFSTVNDRGKPLSNLDKAKGRLITYSRFYLQGSLDGMINDCFGDIFRSYDRIKAISEDLGVRLIRRPDFNEDNILVYHYISYGQRFPNWEYDASPEYVLHNFLKAQLEEERKKDSGSLKAFIEGYVTDLKSFFSALERMLTKLSTNGPLWKLIKILDMSTYLYPLAVRLEQRNMLEPVVDMLEKTEFRVYEMRGTNARVRARLYRLAAAVQWDGAGVNHVRNELADFINAYMSDQEFKRKLEGSAADLPAKYILAEYEAFEKRKQPDWLCTADGINLYSTLEIDHVLPRNPKKMPLGFEGWDDYASVVDRIGNLALLEPPLNEAAGDMMPSAKAHPYYMKSQIESTRVLGSQIQQTGKFDRNDVDARTDMLVQFCLSRWKV